MIDSCSYRRLSPPFLCLAVFCLVLKSKDHCLFTIKVSDVLLKTICLRYLKLRETIGRIGPRPNGLILEGEIKNIPYCGYPKLCTKFIVSLKTQDDRIVTGRDAKVETIWNAFIDIIGCSDNLTMLFDLQSLIMSIAWVEF